jgi:hypothetical protein
MTYEEIKRVYGNTRSNKIKLTEKLYDITRNEDFDRALHNKGLLLKKKLDIPLRDLFKKSGANGQNYKYFIPNYDKMDLDKVTLRMVLDTWHNFYSNLSGNELEREGKLKVYSSQSGDDEDAEIFGLVYYCYHVEADVAESITRRRRENHIPVKDEDKICAFNMGLITFDLDSINYILTKDTLELIDYLLERYDAVEWDADTRNPAVREYKKITELSNGTYYESENAPHKIYFYIRSEDYMKSRQRARQCRKKAQRK